MQPLCTLRASVLLVLVSALGCGCSKKRPEIVVTGDAAPADSAKEQAPAPPPEPIEPILSIAANGSGRAEIRRGWPLIVTARVLHPDAYATDQPVTPLVIAGGTRWSDTIRIEVKNERGEAVSWPLHLGTKAEATLTLDAKTGGDLVWWLSAEQTARLPEGAYTLVAILDFPAGKAHARVAATTSETVSVLVAAEPAAPTAEEREEKDCLLAHHGPLLSGEAEKALGHLDELLRRQPRSIAGLELKGDILAAAGKFDEALTFYDQAANVIRAEYPDTTPPRELLHKQKLALNAIVRGKE